MTGGHNGIRSIKKSMGSGTSPAFGLVSIGRPVDKIRLTMCFVPLVLVERRELPSVVSVAADAVEAHH